MLRQRWGVAKLLGESASAVILSAAKNLVSRSSTEILRCAQDDTRLYHVCQRKLPRPQRCDDCGMTTLTPELRKAVEEAGDQPVEIIDPETQRRYVLLRADVYERLHSLFEERPLSKDEWRFLLEQAGKRAGWDDPEMDVYDDLRPRP